MIVMTLFRLTHMIRSLAAVTFSSCHRQNPLLFI